MYKPIMSLSCHVSVRTTTHICLGTDELGLFPDYLRKPPFAQAPEFFVDYSIAICLSATPHPMIRSGR